jgi:hypothetical protein
VRVFKGNGGKDMTTLTDFGRGNFNGDDLSVGDLILFDNFGGKAIWLENGNGGLLPTSPNGINLPFTGPTWHIVAAADFDGGMPSKPVVPLGDTNPNWASDLLWQNDNGNLALWQSTGSNVNPFAPGTFNQTNLPNPGVGWHVASTNDFDGNGAADILFQHSTGALAIWEFQSFNGTGQGNVLGGAPVIKPGGQLNVDQNPGATWQVVGTGDIDNDLKAGIVFQNSVTNDIAVWESPTQVGGQIHFNIQSNLPNPTAGWHVVGMGHITGTAFGPGDDIVLQHDNGSIAIWELTVVGNQVVRNNPGGDDPTGFNLGNPGPGWHVVGVRDINDDFRADLLLQNDNGAAAVWDNIQFTPGTTNGTHDGFNFTPQPNPSGHLDWHIA